MSKQPCRKCGSILYHKMRVYYPSNKEAVHTCSDCEFMPMTPCYDDVFLGGPGMKTDPNVCDPKTGRPIPFQTKQDKAIAMKIAGVRQSPLAERNHGYRNELYLHPKKYFEVR